LQQWQEINQEVSFHTSFIDLSDKVRAKVEAYAGTPATQDREGFRCQTEEGAQVGQAKPRMAIKIEEGPGNPKSFPLQG
jgi:hypothetical protein